MVGGYIKGFDGLRAYAVLAVMLFHTNISYFQYGWVGVPIFFILSGFLITNILIKTKTSLNYFSVFYARRFLRIFPIYYLALFFVILFAIYTKQNHADWIWFGVYLQNFILSYKNWNVDFPAMFNHTWSLGIEEQFYCFWPIIVKKFNSKWAIIIATSLILLAWIFRYFLSQNLQANPFVWANTISCLDMLLGGSLLAYSIRLFGIKWAIRGSISLVVFVTGVYSVLIALDVIVPFFSKPLDLTSVNGQLFWILLIPYTSLLLIWLINANNTISRLFFTNKIIVYLGKISYGLYLYHYIVFDLLDRYSLVSIPKPIFSLIKIAVTILIASLSWKFIEKRILILKEKLVYKKYENSTVRSHWLRR
ncbi:MAG: acyltransferase [Chitinophagaceae bacterium]|nr:MAG: acyltransferase [Chitinophagaceae bacterium]